MYSDVKSHAWVVWQWRRLQWRRTLGARNKPIAQLRLIRVGKRIEIDSNESVSVPVRTSTYQYIRVCTMIRQTLHFSKFDNIISYPLHRSCAWLFLTLKTLPGYVSKPHNPFQNPIENDALNIWRPHWFWLNTPAVIQHSLSKHLKCLK